MLKTKRARNVLAIEEIIKLSTSPDKMLAKDILNGMHTIGDAFPPD